MTRQKLSRDYVAGLLEPGREFDLNEAALGWAGMPNKNERAITRDVLEALHGAGFLNPGARRREPVPGRRAATQRDTYVS